MPSLQETLAAVLLWTCLDWLQNKLSSYVYWWVSARGIIFREWKLASREQSEGSGGFWVWALHVTHILLDSSSSSLGQRHSPGCRPELLSPLLLFCPRTSSRDCLKDLAIWCLHSWASPIVLSVPQVRHLNPSPSRGSGWQWEGCDSCHYGCHQWHRHLLLPLPVWFCFRTFELLLQLTLLWHRILSDLLGVETGEAAGYPENSWLWGLTCLFNCVWPAAAPGMTETAKGKGTNDTSVVN